MGAALAVLVVPGLLVTPAASAAEPSGVANAAHRGASAVAPENTLAAVVQAVADRADYVECDVRQTKDGVLVLLHDRGLARTTNAESAFPGRAPWRVRDFTLAEVRRLDAGSWKDRSYAGERVPTLAAVLRELSGSASGVFVEVKEPGRYGGVTVVGRRVRDTIAAQWASPGRHEVRVQSFNEAFIRAFARSYPEVRVSTVGLASPSAVAAYADDMQVHHANVTRALVDDAHRHAVAATRRPHADVAAVDLWSLPEHPRPGQGNADHQRHSGQVAVGSGPAPPQRSVADPPLARNRLHRQLRRDHPGLSRAAAAGDQPGRLAVPAGVVRTPRCRAGQDGEHPQALRPGLDPSRKRSLADDPVALRRP
jgi:glycerophosphoryl diester phosphodiesterase